MKNVMSHEVYSSEEFKTFCKKFGINWEADTLDIVIELPLEGFMKVRQTYYTKDDKNSKSIAILNDKEVAILDNTTQHNETWRTHQPLL